MFSTRVRMESTEKENALMGCTSMRKPETALGLTQPVARTVKRTWKSWRTVSSARKAAIRTSDIRIRPTVSTSTCASMEMIRASWAVRTTMKSTTRRRRLAMLQRTRLDAKTGLINNAKTYFLSICKTWTVTDFTKAIKPSKQTCEALKLSEEVQKWNQSSRHHQFRPSEI